MAASPDANDQMWGQKKEGSGQRAAHEPGARSRVSRLPGDSRLQTPATFS